MLDALARYEPVGLRENVYGHLSRLAWVERFIEPDMRVLDFGCGTGVMTTLPLLAGGHDVVGVDLDEKSIRYGRDRARALGLDPERLRACDVRELDERFDLVLASEVLEHIPSPELDAVVDLLVDRLRPGGRLVVTVPNGYGWYEGEAWLWQALRLGEWSERLRIRWFLENAKFRLLGDFVDSAHPSSLDTSPHVQRFTYRGLRRRLEAHGLEIRARRGSVLCAGPVSHLLFAGIKPFLALNLVLGRALSPLAAAFWVVAAKPVAQETGEAGSRCAV